tara:strand:+ start:329 stop:1291 length:963 start_codon:yes stop_codon:yes gene_type:complete
MLIIKQFRKIKRYGILGIIPLIKHALKYYFIKYFTNKYFYKRKIYNYQLYLRLSDPGLSRDLAIRGTREEQLKFIIDKEVASGNVILDVGANIGYYSIMLANIVGSNGKIYALEPEPTNYQTLEKNITLNKLENIIEPYQMGASDTNLPKFLYRSKYSNMHSFILPENDIIDIKNPKSQIEIKMTNLSDFISNKEPIDMLRMDIEGYEVEVLLGLQDAIKNNTWTGKILFECHFKKYNETHNIKNKLEFLFDNGYKTRYVTSTDERKPRIRNLGYKPIKIIQTNDTRFRGIYENISNPDTIQLICNSGGVRDVLFEKIVT